MSEQQNMPHPKRAVFRLPWVAIIFPFLLFFCATPLASYRPWLLWLYLIPVAALFYVVMTRTVVDGEKIATFGLLGGKKIQWDALDGFEFRGPRWAVAVTLDGRRIRLPMVRPRDMLTVAEVSGGWLNLTPRTPEPELDVAESETGLTTPELETVPELGAEPAPSPNEPERAVPESSD